MGYDVSDLVVLRGTICFMMPRVSDGLVNYGTFWVF